MLKKLLMPGIVIMLSLGILTVISCNKTNNNSTSKGAETLENKETQKNKGKVYFDLFDTVSYVYSYRGDSEEEFNANTDLVYYTLLEYHQLFDIYHEYEGINNLCTINSNPYVAISVDEKIIDFLLYAKEMNDLTDGEMDIMMGSVLSLWHDARTSEDVYLPDDESLKSANEYVGFDYIEIDKENSTVKLLSDKAKLDCGALAKGYATEKAAEELEKKGVTSYVLNIGGNIRIIGTKIDGSGWKTGVKNPKDPNGDFIITLTLSDTSCVTSGNYERYFVVDGVKYSHIIDKDTLYPASYYDSVTVITKDSGLADCLSTALYTMDYSSSYSLAIKCGVNAIWVFPSGEVRYTPGLEDLIIK